MNWPASVAKAVGKARDSVDAIQKKKAPDGGVKYAFQGWDDVVPAVRAACKEAGLIISYSVESANVSITEGVNQYDKPTRRSDWHVILNVDLVATEDGGCALAKWTGEAMDSGDKGLQKAITSAYKYGLLKLLQISTEDDKTDSDGHEPERVTRAPMAEVKRAPAAKPAPERPVAEPHVPVQPQKANDPLKTAKLAVKAAAQEAGYTGKEVWGFFADGKDEAGQVMRWAGFCSNEGTPELAAAAIVNLYLEDQDDPFTESAPEAGLPGLTGGAA